MIVPEVVKDVPMVNADRITIKLRHNGQLFVNEELVRIQDGTIDWNDFERKMDEASYRVRKLRGPDAKETTLPTVILITDKRADLEDVLNIAAVARHYAEKIVVTAKQLKTQ